MKSSNFGAMLKGCPTSVGFVFPILVFPILAVSTPVLPAVGGVQGFLEESTLAGEMIYVDEGEFTMGCEGPGCDDDESPEHAVYLDAFYIGKYEVTNQEYRDAVQWAFNNQHVNATSSSVKDSESGRELLDLDDPDCEISYSRGVFSVESGKSDHPVIEVSWYGAACYCDWLSMHIGLTPLYDHEDWSCSVNGPGYRLPTEAEWEKAARGTKKGEYPWGTDEPDCSYLNFKDCEGRTIPVGSCSPKGDSPYGACDMSGNVWEWCNDWYDSRYYHNSSQKNPPGPAGGSSRIHRSGCWTNSADSCRSAGRYENAPHNT